jgi:type II secretory pathway pseudopilin PulG
MKRTRQSGMVLPALLLLVLFGTLAYGFGRQVAQLSAAARQQRATVSQLADARTLLREHAQAYHLTHPGETAGYLPCPDLDNDGSADPPCGIAGTLAVGRFPYRTLGSLPLRDGHGECLWYAVAGSFKNNPKAPGAFNWDTAGQFVVRTADLRALHRLDRPTDAAAALVISPGPPLPGQQRAATTAPCNGAADAATALPGFVEGRWDALAARLDVTQHSPDSASGNDRIAWLPAREIFDDRLARRSDYQALLDGMLDQLVAAVVAGGVILPPATTAPPIGEVERRAVPASAHSGLSRRWADQLQLLRCQSLPGCMTVRDPAGGITPCSGLLIFAGAAGAGQERADRPIDANYFENNLEALADPEHVLFSGPPGFDGGAPAQDLIRCLP